MTPIMQAFTKFKGKYHAAVQTDTLLGECDNNNDRFFRLEKKAKQFWTDAKTAEEEFLKLIGEGI